MKQRNDPVCLGFPRWLAVLMAVHACLLSYGGWVHGPGWDECGHLPAGISHWQLGNTDLYRVNPPLVRMVATIPLSRMDAKLDWAWNSKDTIARPEWDMGRQFFRQHGRNAYWYLAVARWSSIPWSLLAIFIIFRWGKDLYGTGAGLFSAALWCFSPLVLTNAQMITPDAGATALGVAAAFGFRKWLRSGLSGDAFLAGLLLGLAELAKFTWVVLFVLWPIIWILCVIRSRHKKTMNNFRLQTLQFTGIILLALWVINIGYGFEGSFRKLGDFQFVSKSLRGETGSEQTIGPLGNRFEATWLASIVVPVPSNYVLGIDRQKLDFESDFPSYLRGQWRHRGWWYYYVYAVVVKEPLGYLGLFFLTFATYLHCEKTSARRINWNEFFLLTPAVLVFGLVSSQTGFNHHVRYVLPAFPFVFIWMGKLWVSVAAKPVAKLVVLGLLGAAIASSLWVFPHSHAYFNLAAGGPLRGHNHLLDSNIDWGQDILLLADWIETHPDKPLDGVAYSLDSLIHRPSLGITMAQPPESYLGDNVDNEIQRRFGPQPGRYAVFVRPLREQNRRCEYFRLFEPTEVLGYTIYLYEITEHDCQYYWNNRNRLVKTLEQS